MMKGVARFYFQRGFGERGDCFLVLSGGRWTNYMMQRLGIDSQPIFERASQPHEPDSLPNGHPYGWLYKSAEELLKDERRWLNAEQVYALTRAVEGAISTAALETEGAV